MRSLARRLKRGRPGPRAQVRMAPVRDDALDRLAVKERSCREAGVLMMLLPIGDTPHVVVTVRRDHLPDHPGQVSFPGGQRERGESLLETALREAHEEVGLSPSDVEVLGEMTPLFIPPSNFCVYPYLGYALHRPALKPHDYEVERIVEIPLPDLLADGAVRREPWTLHDEEILIPFYDVGGLQIWGATAMMLSELVALASGE
ncbi:MAG: CoA pyrophosphatase [Rhodothermales bacterium]